MQTKRYAITVEDTLAAGGINTSDIVNQSDRRANFHGIRYQGRLRADNASADNEAHGFVAIHCRPAILGGLTESNFDTASDLENQSGIMVAIKPWSVFGGSTNPVGANSFFEWDIVIKTSRTCSKNDELKAIVVSNAESAKSVIISHALLSCFETVL